MLSNFGVIFAPDAAAAAAEMARVLVADGRAVLTAWIPGGAVGALAATARELVREAVGAPATAGGVAWHDVAAVAELFAAHRMRVSLAGRHELVFTADSPEAYLETELSSHPMAIAALDVLRQRGQAEQARQRMLQVLIDNNEAAKSFRATSRYVVLAASR